MAKIANLKSYQHEMDVTITRTVLTIIDRRTGAIGTKEFYRFGERFPIETVGKTLAEYGYDVLGHSDDELVEGTLDLELMFASIKAEEKVTA